ncbi:MAG: hypothetical protein J6K14_03370 [Clostridia bacterium]|nr:hypothetical protein [Clostridia bacterium]
MKKPLILITDSYHGLAKKGVNFLAGALASHMGYTVLPVLTCDKITDTLLSEHTVLAVGCPKTHPLLKKYAERGVISIPGETEGYAIHVGKKEDGETDILLIAGYDEAGVLYGCADFCNKYLARLSTEGDYYTDGHFGCLLKSDLPAFSLSTAPRIPTRAIWTWGHMIYDYRGFFDNMARLRLNEAVIWNDRCPINAEEIVSYAHSLGIKIVWGYAWGWDNSSKLEQVVADSDDAMLARIKEGAIRTYEEEYAGLGDGIYFQSFTEMNKDSVNGKSVADLVVRLVNDTAGALLSRHPDLHIQFGLHATSVKTKTEIIAKVDPRVYIVWEDCGAFPYSYRSYEADGFDETLALTEKLLSLRGENERFGAVLKGLVCLNWGRFEHFSHPYVMGEYPKEFVRERTALKAPLWKNVTAGWLRNAELARRTVALIAEKGNAPIAQMLVEDGCFEGKIPMPVALLAEMLWDAKEDAGKVIERVTKYPFISF